MDESSPESMTALRFVQRNLGRIVIFLVLVSIVYGVMVIALPYQQEQRIAGRIHSLGGKIQLDYFGPERLPPSLSYRLQIFHRISGVVLDESSPDAFTKLNSDLRSLHRFEVLALNGDQLNEPVWEQLASIARLKNLWLRGTQVTSGKLENFHGLTNLAELHLYGTEVDDTGLKYISRLKNLKWLDLRLTKVTGTGLKCLEGFDKLRTLDLSSSQINDAGLEHLRQFTGLERLCLDWTQVSDAGLEHLKEMTSLLSVSFFNETRTTAEGRAMLRKALPNCKVYPEL